MGDQGGGDPNKKVSGDRKTYVPIYRAWWG